MERLVLAGEDTISILFFFTYVWVIMLQEEKLYLYFAVEVKDHKRSTRGAQKKRFYARKLSFKHNEMRKKQKSNVWTVYDK